MIRQYQRTYRCLGLGVDLLTQPQIFLIAFGIELFADILRTVMEVNVVGVNHYIRKSGDSLIRQRHLTSCLKFSLGKYKGRKNFQRCAHIHILKGAIKCIGVYGA